MIVPPRNRDTCNYDLKGSDRVIEDTLFDDFSIGTEITDDDRPFIADLPDAVVPSPAGLIFLPKLGDKVVVEYTEPTQGNRWVSTRTGSVSFIDPSSGNFLCTDDARGQSFGSNYLTYMSNGVTIKLAMGALKKRKRKVAAVVVNKAAKPEVSRATSPEQKRGRGRPKGSKNRPKEVIEAERKKLAAVKAGKKKFRALKRGRKG